MTNMKSSNLRKYTRRQKDLKKALSWWEDQDENPDINYVDFSKRKILFDFGSFRRVVDPGARLELFCFGYGEWNILNSAYILVVAQPLTQSHFQVIFWENGKRQAPN